MPGWILGIHASMARRERARPSCRCATGSPRCRSSPVPQACRTASSETRRSSTAYSSESTAMAAVRAPPRPGLVRRPPAPRAAELRGSSAKCDRHAVRRPPRQATDALDRRRWSRRGCSRGSRISRVERAPRKERSQSWRYESCFKDFDALMDVVWRIRRCCRSPSIASLASASRRAAPTRFRSRRRDR